GGLPRQPRPAARRNAVVQHLTIERMGKLIERRDRSVWQFLESARIQNVGAAGQPLTDHLELTRIGVHSRRRSRDDRECTMLREARHLEHPLLLWAETLDLNLDHLAETLGYGKTDLVQRTPEPPTAALTGDESPPGEVIQGGDHEQGVAFGVPVDERSQSVRQRRFWLFSDKVVDHPGSHQPPQCNRVTQEAGAQGLLERYQQLLREGDRDVTARPNEHT